MSHQYTEELNKVNKRIKQVEEYFKRLDQRLERIESAILGDDKFGQTGYKERIEKLEKENNKLFEKVEDLDNKLKRKLAYFAGAAAVGGGAVWLFLQVLNLLN